MECATTAEDTYLPQGALFLPLQCFSVFESERSVANAHFEAGRVASNARSLGPEMASRSLNGQWNQQRGEAVHVMFVCTGNICRSPTGERLAAAYGAKLDIPNFVTSSAGTRAVIGHPIHEQAALVLEELGGDPTQFAARQLTQKTAMAADLVLAMTREHRDKVLGLAPRLLRRTFTLAEAAAIASRPDAHVIADLAALRPQISAQSLVDVPDPIGRDAATFVAVGKQIAELLPPIIELCARDAPSPGT